MTMKKFIRVEICYYQEKLNILKHQPILISLNQLRVLRRLLPIMQLRKINHRSQWSRNLRKTSYTIVKRKESYRKHRKITHQIKT